MPPRRDWPSLSVVVTCAESVTKEVDPSGLGENRSFKRGRPERKSARGGQRQGSQHGGMRDSGCDGEGDIAGEAAV